MVILLLATVLLVLLGEIFDAGLILIIVLLSAGLGFLQEYRAEKALNQATAHRTWLIWKYQY